MNRFGDIDVSFKRLPPVYGFRSEKCVPIEKALEPIVPEIDELPYYIKIAKKHCHFPSEDGLTQDESAAIYIYTMEWGDTTLYRVLNKALRSENRQVLKIWFPYLKLFDLALNKLPTVKEVVWRGTPIDIGKSFRKNQLVTWWSVNSCSSSVPVIKSFLGNEKNATLFLIEAVNGKKVSGYTEFEKEDEIILPMGSQFRVKSDPLVQSNGSCIIHLIELDDKDDQSSAATMNNMSLTATPSHKSIPATPLRGTDVTLTPSARWSSIATTVVGGHGQGRKLNQLDHPRGLYVHGDQTIYVADCDNHRIVAWAPGAKQGQVVAGGNGYGDGLHQLHSPSDVIVDRSTDTLVICDWQNRRVVRWPRHGGETGKVLLTNIACFGLTMDDRGFLYISDFIKHEVRRFQINADSQGTVVAGGNGKGNGLNQLDWPTHLFVDRDHSLYVSDDYNHRVMKWVEGAREGMIAAGGNGQGDGKDQFDGSGGISFDKYGHLYVSDFGNHRVQRFSLK